MIVDRNIEYKRVNAVCCWTSPLLNLLSSFLSSLLHFVCNTLLLFKSLISNKVRKVAQRYLHWKCCSTAIHMISHGTNILLTLPLLLMLTLFCTRHRWKDQIWSYLENFKWEPDGKCACFLRQKLEQKDNFKFAIEHFLVSLAFRWSQRALLINDHLEVKETVYNLISQIY